jgi:hypothetical protein
MSSPWIQHCKQYQAQHGCSYREALSNAGASYQSQSGGSLKSVARKVRRTVNKGAHHAKKGSAQANSFVKQNGALIDSVNPQAAAALRDANKRLQSTTGAVDHVIDQTGGGVKHLGRKIKHTVHRAKKISKKAAAAMDQAAPFVAMVNPELAATMEVASMGIKSGNQMSGGSFKSYGGSFKSYGGGHMVAAAHPSARPLKPKSYARLKHEN